MSRGYLNASLGPHVAAALLKACGDAMADKATELRAAGRPRLAWEFDDGLEQLRRCVRQLDDPASAFGSAEVPQSRGRSRLRSGAEPGLTTRQVASKLGITDRGVRDLLNRGSGCLLRGDLVHGRWTINPESVADEIRRRRNA